MNCNEASELLSAAVLGDLDRNEQRAVHAHLACCDRCLEEEDELFESMRLLRTHGEIDLGEDFHHTVMARANGIVAEPGMPLPMPPRRVGLLTQTLLTAAATALIVVGLQTTLEAWRQGPAPSPAGTAALGTAIASQSEIPSPSLLDGTLFDRRRNVPDDLRRYKQTRRRGDIQRPLDL